MRMHMIYRSIDSDATGSTWPSTRISRWEPCPAPWLGGMLATCIYMHAQLSDTYTYIRYARACKADVRIRHPRSRALARCPACARTLTMDSRPTRARYTYQSLMSAKYTYSPAARAKPTMWIYRFMSARGTNVSWALINIIYIFNLIGLPAGINLASVQYLVGYNYNLSSRRVRTRIDLAISQRAARAFMKTSIHLAVRSRSRPHT